MTQQTSLPEDGCTMKREGNVDEFIWKWCSLKLPFFGLRLTLWWCSLFRQQSFVCPFLFIWESDRFFGSMPRWCVCEDQSALMTMIEKGQSKKGHASSMPRCACHLTYVHVSIWTRSPIVSLKGQGPRPPHSSTLGIDRMPENRWRGSVTFSARLETTSLSSFFEIEDPNLESSSLYHHLSFPSRSVPHGSNRCVRLCPCTLLTRGTYHAFHR